MIKRNPTFTLYMYKYMCAALPSNLAKIQTITVQRHRCVIHNRMAMASGSDTKCEETTNVSCSVDEETVQENDWLDTCYKKEPTSLSIELYATQKKRYWPWEGQHILAQFDDDTVVLYQAYNPAIADYAVKHQRFGGDFFSFQRMSWIKTNFLWMMYRCGWAAKKNQERVLAVRIKREGFERILSEAYTASLQKSRKMTKEDILVRLQWDPDHDPAGTKQTRRAIQLGLKDQILKMYATEWIVHIEDITPFVRYQHKVFLKSGEEKLQTPSERVYFVSDYSVVTRIQLDLYKDHHYQPVVKSRPVENAEQDEQSECKT